MSSKLRRDLPTVPNEQWSREQIKIFDEHRADYQRWVKVTESLLSDRAFIIDAESAQASRDVKCLLAMINQQTKAAQLLVKYQTTSEQLSFRLNGSFDMVTAFYVPKDLHKLTVIVNNTIIGTFYGSYNEKDLEEILQESWQVPTSETKEYLEHILWISRQGKLGFVHNQDPVINIDGVEYQRLIFMQPMIPTISTGFCDLRVSTDQPAIVYLEVNCCDSLERLAFMKEPVTAWIEDWSYKFPLIRYQAGIVFPVYRQDDRQDRQDLKDYREVLTVLDVVDSFCDPIELPPTLIPDNAPSSII